MNEKNPEQALRFGWGRVVAAIVCYTAQNRAAFCFSWIDCTDLTWQSSPNCICNTCNLHSDYLLLIVANMVFCFSLPPVKQSHHHLITHNFPAEDVTFLGREAWTGGLMESCTWRRHCWGRGGRTPPPSGGKKIRQSLYIDRTAFRPAHFPLYPVCGGKMVPGPTMQKWSQFWSLSSKAFIGVCEAVPKLPE